MAIDVLAALIDTLASHIETNVSGLAAVMRCWPDPRTPIDYPSISLVPAGPVARLKNPEEVSTVDNEDGTVLVTYRIGGLEASIQADIWARSATERGEMQDAVLAAMTTQVAAAGDYPAYRSNSGLYLAMENYYGARAGYALAGIDWPDTEDAAERREFRALLSINGRSDILIQRTQPLLTTMDLDWRVGTQTLEDLASLPPEVQVVFEP